MHGVGIDGFGEIGSDGSRLGIFRVGGTHQFAIQLNGIFPFEHLHNH